MLDLWQNDEAISDRYAVENSARDLPATATDTFDAAWSESQLFGNSLAGTNSRMQAMEEYAQKIRDAGGNLIGGLYGPNALELANNTLAALKTKNPALTLQPMTEDDIARRGVELRQGAVANAAYVAQREQSFTSRLGGIAGGVAGAATDPINIVAAAAAPEAKLGLLGTTLLWGGLGGGSQLINEALQGKEREQVQPGYETSGAPEQNVAGAAVGGAALGATFKALGGLWTRVKTGSWPTSVRDAGNIVESEANIQGSNILPGVEGEAAHREALGRSIDQILNNQPVDAQVGAASRALMARLESERQFAVPVVDMNAVRLTSEEAALREQHGTLQATIDALPSGDQTAADRLNRLQAVEAQLAEATNATDRRALSERRDQILVDTTPEALKEAGAPIEQRRVAAAQQAAIEARLNDIAAERGKLTPAEPTTPVNLGQTSQVPPTLFDLHEQRIDNMMEMRTQAASAEAEMRPTWRNGLEGSVRRLANVGGYDMPRDEAARLTDRLMDARSDDEARAIMNELPARPRTLLDTLPSAAEIARAERANVPPEPLGRAAVEATTPEAIAQIVGSAQHDVALQSAVERAIDDAAKVGKKAMIPIGVDAQGEPIYGSLASALDDIGRDRNAAEQLESCINLSANIGEE